MKVFYFISLAIASVLCDSPNNLCPPVDGPTPVYLPDDDCNKFYECSNGVAILLQCPSGLNFNTESNVCDWPENVGCSQETTTTEQTTTEGEQTGSTETTNEENSEETTSESSEESTEEQSEESTDASSNESSEETTEKSLEDTNEESSESDEVDVKVCGINPDDFFLTPHPNDCNKYVSCNHGRPYVMPCPEGLHFSPVIRVCVPPKQAECQNGPLVN